MTTKAKATPRFKVGLEAKPLRAVKKAISDGLDVYNTAAAGVKPGESEFVLGARNRNGRLLGGFYVVIYFKTAFLKWAWVDDKDRRGGVGRQLMEAAEAEARLRGARIMYLDTFSFQARPFYEKLGYSVFGTLKLGEDGLERYWMSKPL
ncbi:MAG TPA: hypothetical protein DCL54_05815 [Alphaproteobacteria bacterium]|nr:hypothetical protein [Alphaproteobacteria bacterium]HAJ46079.1 hypothetical protein [Alphaproteobacteria bacterium]